MEESDIVSLARIRQYILKDKEDEEARNAQHKNLRRNETNKRTRQQRPGNFCPARFPRQRGALTKTAENREKPETKPITGRAWGNKYEEQRYERLHTASVFSQPRA